MGGVHRKLMQVPPPLETMNRESTPGKSIRPLRTGAGGQTPAKVEKFSFTERCCRAACQRGIRTPSLCARAQCRAPQSPVQQTVGWKQHHVPFPAATLAIAMRWNTAIPARPGITSSPDGPIEEVRLFAWRPPTSHRLNMFRGEHEPEAGSTSGCVPVGHP